MADLGEGPKGGLGSLLFWIKKRVAEGRKATKNQVPPPPLTQGLDLLLI